jgi:type II secretory pathway pseudopilin PulG
MSFSSRKFCGGFTYLAALFMIMIMGIMLGMIGQSWTGLMKREREEELFFRGSQIRNAISRWQTSRGPSASGGQTTSGGMPLGDLKFLLKDPRQLTITRHLRQLYTDPVTGKEWNVIKDPIKGIIGVSSTSDEKPIKQSGFPDEFKTFEGKTKYSEWQFVFGQVPQQGSLKVQLPKTPFMTGP